MTGRTDDPVVTWMRAQVWREYRVALGVGLLAVVVLGLLAVGIAVIL